MSKRSLIICGFSALLMFLFLADNSFAFNRRTRCQILKDAIFLSPQAIKKYLLDHYNDVHDGMHFVDRNSKAGKARKLKNTSYYATMYYISLVKNLKANKMNDFNTVNGFGLLASFIAETISPDNYRTTSNLVLDRFKYEGFHKVKNIKKSVNRLIKEYGKPYKGKTDRAITGHLYKVAVHEIIDHWVSAWIAAGKDPGKFRTQNFVLARKKNSVMKFSRKIIIGGGGGGG